MIKKECHVLSSPPHTQTINSAFSLVELSIVLVILGLLVGGVLMGQDLIHAAKLRAATTEFQKIQTAMATFKDKYFQLPGDMTNATTFWGAIDPTDTTCITMVSPDGKLTCNGNGNGQINNYATDYSERFHAWIHLTNAGLLAGSYSGHSSGGSGTSSIDVGVNAPASKMTPGGWVVAYVDDLAAPATQYYAGHYGNILTLIAEGNAANSRFLTPEEMWNIDTKMDDGKPATGGVFANRAGPTGTWTPNCATNEDASLAEYNLTDTDKECRMTL